MYYRSAIVLDRPIGNNAFVYDVRQELFGKAEIVIPKLVEGTLEDVGLGDSIVFAEEIDGEVREFGGLRDLVCIRALLEPGLPRPHFVRPRNDEVSVYVMDNHNHALYCWYRELLAGKIEKWLPLIHIDQHSDMKDPVRWIDEERENDLSSIATYVNEVCTIADFIQPALRSGLIGECIQIRTENGLLDFPIDSWIASSLHSSQWRSGYILDIDIDFWAPEMGIEEFDRTIQKTRQLIAGASMVTIATSPCFIEQERAVEIVKLLLK